MFYNFSLLLLLLLLIYDDDDDDDVKNLCFSCLQYLSKIYSNGNYKINATPTISNECIFFVLGNINIRHLMYCHPLDEFLPIKNKFHEVIAL